MRKPKQKIKILKNKPPKHMRFTLTHYASLMQQVREIVASYPKDMDVKVVKIGKRGDQYPYAIYAREHESW